MKKRFVVMCERSGLMNHYMVGCWNPEDEVSGHPTILDGTGSVSFDEAFDHANDDGGNHAARECAAIVAEWNRLERDTWHPEDASS
jgi:hypothetical protein